jgi:hypothetical protein
LTLAHRLLFGLLFVCALVHVPSLGGGFVWDDLSLLRDRPTAHRVDTALPEALSDFFPATLSAPGGGYLRPLPVLVNAVTWQLTEGAPLAFRLTNLLVHLANVALVFGLGRRLGLSTVAAALGAATFGLHPALTEAVDFISGRTDLFAAFFCLLAAHGVVAGTRWGSLGALLAFCLALGSKEVALGALPALCLLAAPGRHRRTVGLALGAVAVAVIAGRLLADVEGPALRLVDPADRPVAVPNLTAFYAALAVLPIDLRAVYALPDLPHFGFDTIVGIVLLVGGAALVWRGRGVARWGTLLALGTLLPVLHLVPISTLVAPRYLYVPLVGLGLVVAALWDRLRPPARLGLALPPLLGLALTPLRAADWQTESTLWTAELQADPDSFVAHQNLGATCAEAGDLPCARRHFTEALRQRPGSDVLRRNLERLERLGDR